VGNSRPVATRGEQGIVQRSCQIRRFHRRAEPPGDDIAAVVAEDRREVESAPANDLQVGEVCLPELVRLGGLLVELAVVPGDGDVFSIISLDRTKR